MKHFLLYFLSVGSNRTSESEIPDPTPTLESNFKNFWIWLLEATVQRQNAMLTIVGKSNMSKNRGFLSFTHSCKKWKRSLKHDFVFDSLWKKTLETHLFLAALPRRIKHLYERSFTTTACTQSTYAYVKNKEKNDTASHAMNIHQRGNMWYTRENLGLSGTFRGLIHVRNDDQQ